MVWLRLIPMAAMTFFVCWYLLTFPIKFTDVAYDTNVDLFSYGTCAMSIVYTFVLAIFKRHETSNLLKGLEGRLKPVKVWESIISNLIFLLYVGSTLFINYTTSNWQSISLVYWISMALINPIIPLVLDLYVIHLISALSQVYAGAVDQVLSRRCSDANSQFLPDPQESLFSETHSRCCVALQVRHILLICDC